MAKGGRRRQGKIVTGGHSTKVEGLDKLITQITKWPEIDSIRLGAIHAANRVGRKTKRLAVTADRVDPVTSEPEIKGLSIAVTKSHKRATKGGGFSFKATRPAYVGNIITGVRCEARFSTTIQEVVLCGPDHLAIWQRLIQEGYYVPPG